MKKIKYLLICLSLFCMTGCFNNDTMDNINVATSVYPIQYIIDALYGTHSKITSIYPSDSEAMNFEVTDTLLKQYSNTDLFIFNGLSESEYVKKLSKVNDKLKIINAIDNMNFNYSMEELWLDPNNLLTITNNIKKGLEEYITSSYLIKNINENYEKLKIELTSLDGKYYSASNKASNNIIIVNDDAFMYLKKYGIDVISLDPDTVTLKEITRAKELLKKGTCNYIYFKYGQDDDDIVDDLKDNVDYKKAELYTMTNLYDVNIEKNNYITLMDQNLANIKLELYK